MKEIKWIGLTIGLFMTGILFCAVINRIVDPFFHYGTGLGCLQYPLKEEWYINDGIQRNYDYELMITGTSMSLNFSSSLTEDLSGKKTIKTAYSGATFHELNEAMEHAISYNPKLEMIICSFDPNRMDGDALENEHEGKPEYLYDSNHFNDIKYLLNKDVLVDSVSVINYTRAGNKTPSMDDFGKFDIYMTTGKEAVLSTFKRTENRDSQVDFTESDRMRVKENIRRNLIDIAVKHPEITFVYYIPPYSVYHWDELVRTGKLNYVTEVEKCATSLMFEAENIRVYGFDDMVDITTNPDNYMDTLHYTSEICDILTERIFADEGRLNKDNYFAYFEDIKGYYQELNMDEFY